MVGCVLGLMASMLLWSTSAHAGVVYDNIEAASLIDNPVSLGYAATGTTQFGSQVAMTETAEEPEVEVLMSVWACESGGWTSSCETDDPLATFPAELTLNVYKVDYENGIGDKVASDTETFDLPYRPSSGGCSDPTKFKASDGNCQHGLPVPVTFDLGTAIPRKAILAVEFASSSDATDSLNVGLEGPASVGSDPLESSEGIYWDSQWFGTKSTEFRLEEETGEWWVGESQMAAKVTTAGSDVVVGPEGPKGETGAAGANGETGATGETGAEGKNGTGSSSKSSVALKRKMSLRFLDGTATVSGGDAAVKVRCLGSESKRCVGSLSLTVSGQTVKASYSVAAGKSATIKVPLGGAQPTTLGTTIVAKVVAKTLQVSGGSVTTRRTLHLS